MKIALFTDTYLPQMNGVVACIDDAIRMLKRYNEVVLFAPHDGPMEVEVSGNLKIYRIPSAPFPFYEGYRIASVDYRRISDLLGKEMPDIVHAHAPVMLGLQGVISAKRKRIPVVVTYHTHFPDYLPHLLDGKLPKALEKASSFTVKKLIKHVFSMADVVTAPTRELVQELESYGLRNVTYLPNGVDLKRFRKDKVSEKEFRARYKIPKKRIALYLGRISFEKRIDRLIKAFHRIENQDRLLLITGGGPYLKQFQDFAKAIGLKNVIFTGFVKRKHLSAAYGCADLFASASDTETFGLTFVEAMHVGLPVIGVRRFGAKEIIEHGKSGLLVEPDDELALADAMDRLLRDGALRRRMGKAAHERAKGYSLEKSIERTLEIYEGLLGGDGGST